MSSRSKYLAGSSLAVMGAGFVATLPFTTPIGALLQGGFEAGLVGGLADWFAVTALFRHPLGIPIPHTALLPKNRVRVTNGLIHMLENDWLTKESITSKLQHLELAEKLVELIEEKIETDAAKEAITIVAEKVVTSIDTTQLAHNIGPTIKSYLSGVQTAPILSSLVNQILTQQYEEKALDYILIKVKEWAEQTTTRQQLGTVALQALQNIQLEGFLQFAIKSFLNVIDAEKLGGFIQDFLLGGIRSLQDEDNNNRLLLLQKIRTELENGKENEKLLASVEKWKETLLNKWDITTTIEKLLEKAKQAASTFIKNGKFITLALPFLARLIKDTKQNSVYMQSFNRVLQVQITTLVEQNHAKIGKLVRENLDKLDDKTLITMIENNVGKDLQWIRVNGAVCGFLIGLGLTGFKLLL